ncbi:MAG: methyltransferase domain-containing protein [Acidimicrobiia bacterium]|nr:methyltransferase domain-containing protein [Acidimicrobiia bacterium]
MPKNPIRRVTDEVVELFAHPGGRAARPRAHALNFFNRQGNRRVATALDLRAGQHVLEVGFGGGAAIPTTAAALGGSGKLCGVDLSADMARLAADRFGRAVFACGDAQALPLRGRTFDHAYAMHSHLYWPSPAAGIREIHRVPRSGGRLLLGMDVVSGIRLLEWFGPNYAPAKPALLVQLLTDAGFTDVRTEHLTRGVVAVIGVKP